MEAPPRAYAARAILPRKRQTEEVLASQKKSVAALSLSLMNIARRVCRRLVKVTLRKRSSCFLACKCCSPKFPQEAERARGHESWREGRRYACLRVHQSSCPHRCSGGRRRPHSCTAIAYSTFQTLPFCSAPTGLTVSAIPRRRKGRPRCSHPRGLSHYSWKQRSTCSSSRASGCHPYVCCAYPSACRLCPKGHACLSS